MTAGTARTSGDDRGRAAERRTLGAISLAHFVSHFHILSLPALFPFFKDTMQVGYVELGLAVTVFNVVSGVTQGPMGFVVDRHGPKRVLICGLLLAGLAFFALAAAPTYACLLLLAVLAGTANAVYHPADYAILSASIPEGRIGRAYSLHTFAGFFGSAVAPPTMFALVGLAGMQAAIAASGMLALLAVAGLMPTEIRRTAERPVRRGATPDGASGRLPVKAFLTSTILALTLFYAFLNFSTAGIQNFSLVALMSGYGLGHAAANTALTAFLLASALGVLIGGQIADRTHRHGAVTTACFGLAALLVLAVAVLDPEPVVLTVLLASAGLLTGMITASRDMIVRRAAPPGAEGRVFGIVSTGFNFGGAISPVLFGWIMDQSLPRGVFAAAAFFMALTAMLVWMQDRKSRRHPG